MIGKRLLLIPLFLILISFSCFSTVNSYTRINDRCTVVELTTDAFLSHKLMSDGGGSVYAESSENVQTAGLNDTGYYYYRQNLALVGITGITGDVKLSVSEPTGGWFYILPGAEEYKRPYGIDVFARARAKSGDTNLTDSDGNLSYSVHFGNQEYAAHSGDVTIPAEVAEQYNYIWWDIALVLDPLINTQENSVSLGGNVYYLSPSSSYYTSQLEFTISCGEKDTPGYYERTYNVYLAGLYSASNTNIPHNAMTAILSTTRRTSAGSLDINTMAKSNPSQEIIVADYGFSTDSKSGTQYQNGKFYLFLSSSPNARASSSTFTLNKISDYGTSIEPLTQTNSIHYKAYLNSKSGKTYDDNTSSRTLEGVIYQTSIEYTGTDTLNTPGNFLRLNSTSMVDRDGKTYWRFDDQGTISIVIPNDSAFQGRDLGVNNESGYINLDQGLYTSTIYVHVVSDL